MEKEKLKESFKLEQIANATNYGKVESMFSMEENASFITSSGHFHILFKNGYEVSLFNGRGSYTDNFYCNEADEEIYSKYIEVAIIHNDYFKTRDFIEGAEDDVIGLVEADELIDIINKVKNYEVK